jgi:hypothetical protein
MAQATYPWQSNGNVERAPCLPPPSAGGLKRSKKRQRSDNDAGSHESTQKRQQMPVSCHPSEISLPPLTSRDPTEVINLVDDDDDHRPLPQHGTYHSDGVHHMYQIQGPGSLVAGSQLQPLEIEDDPPSKRSFSPAYHSVDSGRSKVPLRSPPKFPRPPFLDHINSTGLLSSAGVPPTPSAVPETVAADIVPIVEPALCPEQAELVDLILSRRNVFYTGSAGCGKSTVLKAFVKRFQERGMRVNIIAPTGRAALDINGSTTWTYAGWTPDSHKKPLKDLKIAAHGKFVRMRLNETDVLVIDEISMVENLHFERLNAVMKEARNSEKAFGGVQLVVTGDFCQLPPVKPFGHCIECGRELVKNRQETEFKCRTHGTYYDADKWAFRSKAWKECNFEHVNLSTIHRQSDKVFIDILNNLRMGIRLPQASIDLLLNHESETRGAIKLFATREEVKRVNDEKFKALPTTARTYVCLDHFHWNDRHGNLRSKGDRGPDGSLLSLRDHRFESQIQLKKGMLVVLLHNLDLGSGLVNGSQGTIQGFEDYDPLKMPKAVTTRREREGDYLPGVPILQGDQAVFREGQLKCYAKQMNYKAWPIVRFLNGVERTIYAECE